MVTLLNRAEEGEVVYSRPHRHAEIRLATRELVLTQTRYDENQTGASPHIHKLHTDCFYVLEGALRFFLGDGERVVAAGGFLAVPPGVVHGFENGFAGESRFLNIHAPNTGFDEYLRTIGAAQDPQAKRIISERTDSWEPEEGWRDATDARVVEAEPAEVLEVRTPLTRVVYVASGSVRIGDTDLHPGDCAVTTEAVPGARVLEVPAPR